MHTPLNFDSSLGLRRLWNHHKSELRRKACTISEQMDPSQAYMINWSIAQLMYFQMHLDSWCSLTFDRLGYYLKPQNERAYSSCFIQHWWQISSIRLQIRPNKSTIVNTIIWCQSIYDAWRGSRNMCLFELHSRARISFHQTTLQLNESHVWENHCSVPPVQYHPVTSPL